MYVRQAHIALLTCKYLPFFPPFFFLIYTNYILIFLPMCFKNCTRCMMAACTNKNDFLNSFFVFLSPVLLLASKMCWLQCFGSLSLSCFSFFSLIIFFSSLFGNRACRCFIYLLERNKKKGKEGEKKKKKKRNFWKNELNTDCRLYWILYF